MSFLSALGSVASNAISGGLLGSVATGLFNLQATDRANAANKTMTRETNALNKEIAEQNLGFQRENLEYQKALQQQIFEREDTAYQRTVDDMRAAGLSPLSMQNTNGAGEAIATNALNNGFQAQQAPSAQSAAGAFDSLTTVLENAAQRELQRDSIEVERMKANAQAALTEAQAEAQRIQNEYLRDKYHLENVNMNLRNQGLSWENLFHGDDYDRRRKQNEYMARFGLVDGMTDKERIAAIVSGSLGLTDARPANDWSYNYNPDGSLEHYSSGTPSDYFDDFGKLFTGIQVAAGVNELLGNLPFKKFIGNIRKTGKKNKDNSDDFDWLPF